MPNRETGEVLEKWDIINKNYPVSAISYYRGGVIIHRTPAGKVAKPDRPRSNKIEKLSRSSLNKLAFLVSTTNVRFKSLMTLTYENIPRNGKKVKKQLNYFLTYLRRRFNHFKIEYLWFLEFQKRGSPHFHILLNIKVPIVSRETILRKWVDIVGGSGNAIKVALHKTSWENIRLEDGAKRYAVKYALKPEQKRVPVRYKDVGRFWGASRGVKSEPIVSEFPINESLARDIISELRPDTKGVFTKLLPRYIYTN